MAGQPPGYLVGLLCTGRCMVNRSTTRRSAIGSGGAEESGRTVTALMTVACTEEVDREHGYSTLLSSALSTPSTPSKLYV